MVCELTVTCGAGQGVCEGTCCRWCWVMTMSMLMMRLLRDDIDADNAVVVIMMLMLMPLSILMMMSMLMRFSRGAEALVLALLRAPHPLRVQALPPHHPQHTRCTPAPLPPSSFPGWTPPVSHKLLLGTGHVRLHHRSAHGLDAGGGVTCCAVSMCARAVGRRVLRRGWRRGWERAGGSWRRASPRLPPLPRAREHRLACSSRQRAERACLWALKNHEALSAEQNVRMCWDM